MRVCAYGSNNIIINSFYKFINFILLSESYFILWYILLLILNWSKLINLEGVIGARSNDAGYVLKCLYHHRQIFSYILASLLGEVDTQVRDNLSPFVLICMYNMIDYLASPRMGDVDKLGLIFSMWLIHDKKEIFAYPKKVMWF